MHTMRKIFALGMVAMLSLTIALAAVGCGKKADEAPATSTESAPPAETMPADTGMAGMSSDSTMADTSMHQ
jgi:hypothetical protein